MFPSSSFCSRDVATQVEHGLYVTTAQLVAAEDKKIPLHRLQNQRSTQQENYAGLPTALVGISRLLGLHRGPAVSFVVLYRLNTAENITIRVNNPTQDRPEIGTAASAPIINRTAASEMGLLAFVKGVLEDITTRQKQVYLPLDGFASSIPPEPLRCLTDRVRLVFASPERRRSKSAPPKPEPAEDADVNEEQPLPDDWPDEPENLTFRNLRSKAWPSLTTIKSARPYRLSPATRSLCIQSSKSLSRPLRHSKGWSSSAFPSLA
ncbi:hypothetical protein LTR17_009228 [Elasticomyces elasticus]|nr:hypothetical protein LTR17_009228 [Elasticomyces elasticus]